MALRQHRIGCFSVRRYVGAQFAQCSFDSGRGGRESADKLLRNERWVQQHLASGDAAIPFEDDVLPSLNNGDDALTMKETFVPNDSSCEVKHVFESQQFRANLGRLGVRFNFDTRIA
ncbi:hypothetical protein WS90_34070 [Burkholderia cepacia]|uniref:Uncharacterized protein n=1 Tax=Burkholderia cepacia TaxID=292 RepID=A0A103Z2L9_BURCE|nr:hypothetical protein WS90_34070 [Burkholderia cepacia]